MAHRRRDLLSSRRSKITQLYELTARFDKMVELAVVIRCAARDGAARSCLGRVEHLALVWFPSESIPARRKERPMPLVALKKRSAWASVSAG